MRRGGWGGEKTSNHRGYGESLRIAMNEWFQESNVVRAIAAYLRAEGWIVERIASTESHEKGVDIQARQGDELLLVEVKGYPLTVYQYGRNKGKHKPTKPDTQARHWYSEILLSAILLQEQSP